jgi:hypothetical protein
MVNQLHIARGLSLPLDAVTQKIAILGTSGSGKSYCMTKLAEQMLEAKAQVVIIDPKSEAWGLRLKADGKTPAYDIPVLGGEHGDAPLRPDMGARVAELIVANDYSCVLDVSEFIPQEWAQFCYEFSTRLLQLKKQRKSAMCLMIDEAHDFIPQNPDEKGWVPKMLGAMQRIQKLGRALGIGMVLSSQRPQEVSKKALNLCELWITFQLIGTQERVSTIKTIGERDSAAAAAIDAQLPTLEIGRAYLWSPRWLKVMGVYHVLQKTTFDSSATPEVGAKPVEPRKLSRVHLEALQEDLREVIEEAEANDPERLKKEKAELLRQIGALKREVEQARKEVPPAETKVERVEVPVITEEQLTRIGEMVERLEALRPYAVDMQAALDGADDVRDYLTDALRRFKVAKEMPAPRVELPPTRPISPSPPAARAVGVPRPAGNVSGPQQKLLDALAWFESVGIRAPTRTNVAAMAGVSPRSSGFEKNVSTLRSQLGLIDYPADGCLALTSAGRDAANFPVTPASLAALHEAWLRSPALSGPQAQMLEALIRLYPRQASREELAERLERSAQSSGFEKNVSTLSGLGLVRYPAPGYVVATELLFPEGLD